jgi:hypothetical protein
MNIPSESFEPVRPVQSAAMTGSRRSHAKSSATGESATPGDALQPHAVDAVFADETAPVVAQRGSRRDLVAPAGTPETAKHKVDVPHVSMSADFVTDAQATRMLRSLGQQIDALREQQEQIRRMIEQVELFSTRGVAKR